MAKGGRQWLTPSGPRWRGRHGSIGGALTAFVVGCCIFGLWRDRVMDRVVVGVMLIGLAVATMLFHDVATARLAALRAEREGEDG